MDERSEIFARQTARHDQLIAIARDNPELDDLGEAFVEAVVKVRIAHQKLKLSRSESWSAFAYMISEALEVTR